MQEIGLHELEIGQHAVVTHLHIAGSIRRRLLDLGLAEQSTVQCVGRAPSGDPIAFLIRGAVIALRAEDCRWVMIRRIQQWD